MKAAYRLMWFLVVLLVGASCITLIVVKNNRDTEVIVEDGEIIEPDLTHGLIIVKDSI